MTIFEHLISAMLAYFRKIMHAIIEAIIAKMTTTIIEEFFAAISTIVL